MTSTTPLFHDEHVAGGWTEFDTVTRRICTALWHATDAFKRIDRYESDVVLDYMTLLEAVTALEPGVSIDFVYSVGDMGTHLAVNFPGRTTGSYENHVTSVLDYDSGPATAKFTATLSRADYKTDEYGHRYGADRYSLTIDPVV